MRAFISFLLFENPDETLALVHEILQKNLVSNKVFITVMDKTLTPSPWTTPIDYLNGLL